MTTSSSQTPETSHDSLSPHTQPGDESHPVDFIVEGKDMKTGVWRRLFVHADGKNAAMEVATERGVEAHTVREAHSEERPETGADAPQREFGVAGFLSLIVGVLGALTIPFALTMRGEMPTFALVTGVAGVLLLLYGLVGTSVFYAMHLHNRRHHAGVA